MGLVSIKKNAPPYFTKDDILPLPLPPPPNEQDDDGGDEPAKEENHPHSDQKYLHRSNNHPICELKRKFRKNNSGNVQNT